MPGAYASGVPAASGDPSKRVADLEAGDETLQYGVVTHREGRKVWFERRIVTFPSETDTVAVTPGSVDHRR